MGNSHSNEVSQTPRKERPASAGQSATPPSTIKKRTSIRRQPHQVLSSSSPPIARKGSADTASTVDQHDKLSLLEEGSSVPQSASRSRQDSIVTSTSIAELSEFEEAEGATDERIPITIKWYGPGTKIYILGSFTNWRRKIPMKKLEGEKEFTASLHLTPGTHRLKFDVDGEWKINDNMAVATDSGGTFVNYVEVQAEEDLSLTRDHKQTSHVSDISEDDQPRWTDKIPSFMTTTDEPVTPPSLPPHLEKVILNTSNERKDDHSVLPHPNHVVLNHLAASSIRNGVLAVSASTRYRRKYVTTILYKPSGQ